MNAQSFTNKVVLLTGAAGGFGRVLVSKLAQLNAKLVLGDIDFARLEQMLEAYKNTGVDFIIRPCDVSQEAEVESLVQAAVDQYGQLDIAINNAGLSSPIKALIDTTEKDLDINFAVNAKGVFFGMKHQIRQMLSQAQGGTILNVASKAGLGGAQKLTAYCAAKHAVVGMTKTAALEYAHKNIRINAICPYFSPTPLVTNGIDPALLESLASISPMRRLGEPEEMVQAMLMLIDPENSYLNGQAIAVDGGMSAA